MVTSGRRGSQIGLAPGALVHVGEKKVEKVVIRVLAYNSEKLIERKLEKVEECLEFKDQPDLNLWIDVDGLDRVDIIGKLGGYFNIHPLTLEDILNTRQRPKTEDYDSYIYSVLKMILLDTKTKEITIDQVSIIIGPNYVSLFRKGMVKFLTRCGKGLKIRLLACGKAGWIILPTALLMLLSITIF